MAIKLSGKNLWNLYVMLAADGLAFLVALYQQFHVVREGGVYIHTEASKRIVWIIFGVMAALTVLFVFLSREEEVIKGLPPKKNEFDDEG